MVGVYFLRRCGLRHLHQGIQDLEAGILHLEGMLGSMLVLDRSCLGIEAQSAQVLCRLELEVAVEFGIVGLGIAVIGCIEVLSMLELGIEFGRCFRRLASSSQRIRALAMPLLLGRTFFSW